MSQVRGDVSLMVADILPCFDEVTIYNDNLQLVVTIQMFGSQWNQLVSLHLTWHARCY